jgi:hypothetical protein
MLMVCGKPCGAVCVMVGVACASAPGCGGHGAHVEPDGPLGEVTIKTFPDGVPSITGKTENAMLVAFQDGDGPWTALTGTGGVYQASPGSPRYGVAVGCVSNGRSDVNLYYRSLSDPRELLAAGCPSPVETAHVSIDLRGVQAGERAEVWVGDSEAFASADGAIGLTVLKAPADVFARSYVLSNTIPTPGATNNVRAYRGTALDPSSTSSLQIDLASSARALEFHPLTVVDPAPPGSRTAFTVRSVLFTRNSQTNWPVHASGTVQSGAAPPDRYATLDAAMRQPDDISSIHVFADAAIDASSTVGYLRSARRSFKDPVAQSVMLPDLVAVQAPVVASTGTPWLTATIPIVPSRLGFITYEALFGGTVSGPDDRGWDVAISADWAAIKSSGQSSVTISLPDLSNLPGWRPEMALDATSYDTWNIGWVDRNMPVSTLLKAN